MTKPDVNDVRAPDRNYAPTALVIPRVILCSACGRADTHGLGVRKAASGACCYAARSQGPRCGTDPLAGRCRCPCIRPCCTSGTDTWLPRRAGLRWPVWRGRRHKQSVGVSFQGIRGGSGWYDDKITVTLVQFHTRFQPWIVTVACAKPHSSAAGARALSKLTPRAPVSILLHDVGGQPDAVTFEAVLHWAERTRQVEIVFFF